MTDRDDRALIEEHLAEILDGDAAPELYALLAEDDELRDLRHQAEEAVALTRAAGDDHVSPPDLEARLLLALDARAAFEAPPGATVGSPPPTLSDLGSGATIPGDSPVLETTASAPSPVAAPRGEGLAPIFDFVARRRAWFLAGGGGLAALGALAASVAGLVALRGVPELPGFGGGGWSGTVAHVARAGGLGELELCATNGTDCHALRAGDRVPAGAVVRTGPTVRAHLSLADGTELSLDRGTRLAFDASVSRRLRVDQGAIVADVKHQAGAPARLDLPVGNVEVLGTKFSLVARPDAAQISVSRGEVVLTDTSERSVRVHAGEEGRLYADQEPQAMATQQLGEMLAWSDEARESPDADLPARGLGELRAKKPTDKSERDNAVTLTSHSIKVRIAGAVARTEVEEVFSNETGDVLEGIYRFPMPPDAKIERLALEVDGRLEEGAFVDRDRAAAIWRGSIVNAAPELRREMRDEIVWVPGPWKDPALLEWQRGSRFELRIFPIPARGSRRVVLAYTQVLHPTGALRRYTYPLAHDPSGSTRVSDFRVDVQVRGHDAHRGVVPRGYPMAVGNQGDIAAITHSERDFVPAGDLVLEYALPNGDREVTAWAYAPTPKDAGSPTSVGSPAHAVAETKDALGTEPYVAIALRPLLPRQTEHEQRTYGLVVDSSRSMFGESYKRAAVLAARLVRELDDEDRFTLLACDTTCRTLPGGVQAPGRKAGDEVRAWLSGLTPEGASDPTAAIAAAHRAAQAGQGSLRIVYFGDGTPTAGPLRPATVTDAVRRAVPREAGTVTAVAIGADSDLESLGALARGGGGVVLPYVPGQSTAEAAFAALGATLGHSLREVELELPAGLVAQAPTTLDTIPAGGETIVVARMLRPDVAGDVVLRGTVGNTRFERRYPLRLAATTNAGNAFVPRLYAATRITELERRGDAEAKAEAIALSSQLDVASRYTSLLVLESAAMFKAFGLDNTRDAPEWTGEEEAETATAGGETKAVEDELALSLEAPSAGQAKGEASSSRGGDGWFGREKVKSSAASAGDEAKRRAESPAPAGAAPRSAPKPDSAPGAADAWPGNRGRIAAGASPPADTRAEAPPAALTEWGGRRDWVPMRRVWERKGEVVVGRAVPQAASVGRLAAAERAVTEQPNQRGAVRDLYVLYAVSGDLPRAEELAERWSEKEPLDPEALTARADLAAQRGDRELAVRILGSVVEVRPGDVKAQERLARLHRWAGRQELGCRHTIAVAELHQQDDRLLSGAVECARATGEASLAEALLAAAAPATRGAAERRAASPTAATGLSGDLRLEATWGSDGHDLDLGLVTPEGHRVSWLGAPTREVISAEDVLSERREALALRGAAPGEYVIEIVRGEGSGTVSGEVLVRVAGTQRTIPFTLSGNRVAVGIARITQESRLVPAN